MRGISRIYTVVGLVLIIKASPCFPTDVNTQNEESEHLESAQSAQLQDPAKEPQEVEIQQKAEQPVAIENELNRQLLRHASSAGIAFVKALYINNLLSKGADINAIDEYGLTSLHHAVERENKNTATLLLANRADVDCKDNVGRTPLHYAFGAYLGCGNLQEFPIDIAQILLDNGADINAQDNIGWTPLHYSASKANKSAIKFLINRGADLNCIDKRGRTPYLYAREGALYHESISGPEFRHHFADEYAGVLALLRNDHYRYCVSTDGKDTNPGTLEFPLRTINAAVHLAEPNDVIVVRGGVYRCVHVINLDRSGEQGRPIVLKAYAGEAPILDFSSVPEAPMTITGAYWHLKGLTIAKGERYGVRIQGKNAHHNILEQITAYDNSYAGIGIERDAAYNIVFNCDSHNNYELSFNGDDADGFGLFWSVGRGTVLIGNRAWNNADDGFDLYGSNYSARVERCYAWSNGVNIWNNPFFKGNAVGFKLSKGTGRHIAIDCMAWNHPRRGFDLSGNTGGVILINCTALRNNPNYRFNYSTWVKGPSLCVFSNNVSYDGVEKDSFHPNANSQHNSWDAELGLTLTDADFVSFDDSMMSALRNPDGSIPENNFLKLAPGSKAIDKGVDIGMPFAGERPDLGAFEYDPNASNQGYVKMLHQAVRDHDANEINRLLAAGEGINDKDWLGYTPLHWAVYFGYSDFIELLISKEADPDIQSDTGRYALEIARAMAYPELVALLHKLGAKAGDVSTDEGPQETRATEEQKPSAIVN